MCHGRGQAAAIAPALINTSSMRTRSQAQIQEIIRNGTARGMSAFPLPDDHLARIARWLRANNASAFETRPVGDVAAGEAFFYGGGDCASCHMVRGKGGANAPD